MFLSLTRYAMKNKQPTRDLNRFLTELKGQLMLATPNAEEVEEFKNLYKKRFNVELTDKEARETATAYLQMFQLLTEEGQEEDSSNELE